MTPEERPEPVSSSERWWYNLKTGAAEFGRFADSANRIGPFQTKSEAEAALETLKRRSQEWLDSETEED